MNHLPDNFTIKITNFSRYLRQLISASFANRSFPDSSSVLSNLPIFRYFNWYTGKKKTYKAPVLPKWFFYDFAERKTRVKETAISATLAHLENWWMNKKLKLMNKNRIIFEEPHVIVTERNHVSLLTQSKSCIISFKKGFRFKRVLESTNRPGIYIKIFWVYCAST